MCAQQMAGFPQISQGCALPAEPALPPTQRGSSICPLLLTCSPSCLTACSFWLVCSTSKSWDILEVCAVCMPLSF